MTTKPTPIFGTTTIDELQVGISTNTDDVSIVAVTSGVNDYDSKIVFSGGKTASSISSQMPLLNAGNIGDSTLTVVGKYLAEPNTVITTVLSSTTYTIDGISYGTTNLTTINLSKATTGNVLANSIITVLNQTTNTSSNYTVYSTAVTGSTSIIIVGKVEFNSSIVYSVTGTGIASNTIVNSSAISAIDTSILSLTSTLSATVAQGTNITIVSTYQPTPGMGSMEFDGETITVTGNGVNSSFNVNTENVVINSNIDLTGSDHVLVPAVTNYSNPNSAINLDYAIENFATTEYVQTQIDNVNSQVASSGYPSIAPENRAPVSTDDTTKGYIVGDYWYYNTSLWKATSVTTNSAVWQLQSVTKKPGDIFGTNTLFAGGPSQVVSGYTGKCIDVSTTVGGTATTTTINLLSNGSFDIDTFLATSLAADNGTYTFVTKVYDQTGNGNNLVATSNSVVHTGVVYINGLPTLTWGYDQTAGGFVIPNTLTVTEQNFFFGSLGSSIHCNTGNISPCPVTFGNSASKEVKVFNGYYEEDGYLHVIQNNNFEYIIELSNHCEPAPFCFYSYNGGFGSTSLTDSATVSAYGQTNDTLTGGYIGYNATYATGGSDYYTTGINSGIYSGIVIANVSPTSTQIDQFVQSGIVYGKYTPQSRNNLVIVGDSRSAGYHIYDNTPWPTLLQNYQGMKLFNFATSGAQTSDYLKYLPAISKLRSYSNNIAFVWGGINDIANGNTALDAIKNIQQIVTTLQGYGFKVYVISEMETNNNSSVVRGPLENALKMGVIHYDRWIDPFSEGQVMNSTASTDNFNTDATHPTNKGQQVLCDFIWERLKNDMV